MLERKAILVVDDEPDLREILSDEFSLSGAQVDVASNGCEALRKARSRAFDAVISDLRMPGGDGIELAKALKAQPNSPVLILMTGFADLSGEEAYEIGAEGFLTKPFHLEAVHEVLGRLLTPAFERWARPAAEPSRVLEASPALYAEQPTSSYLGRGGFFFSGERLVTRQLSERYSPAYLPRGF
jgi:CheY-like chemotaxis protein